VHYLEDALALLEGESGDDGSRSGGLKLSKEDADVMDEALSTAWLADDFELLLQLVSENQGSSLCNYQHPLTGATPLMVAAGKGRIDDVTLFLSLGADQSTASLDGATALDWAKQNGQEEVVEFLTNYQEEKMASTSSAEAELLRKYQSSIDQDEIDAGLIERLLKVICKTPGEGRDRNDNEAVLVFLPGWEDIMKARDVLLASPIFGDSSRFLVLPLHSMVPSSEQRKVFARPPSGVRKIVLSTNIAETAITIDDVVFVIDSGRMKEKSYDPYSNVSTLQTAWISKASSKQREGRAGRCQPGVCYHLFSRMRAVSLPDFQLPEIKRTPLEELCLQVGILLRNLLQTLL
jgi:ATP-dependent RNA helicase DHX36